MECRVVNHMDAGDREVFLGEVVDGRRLKQEDLLTYPHFLSSASPEMMEEYRTYMAPLRPAIAEMAQQLRPNA
jgi:flavin reductase (DIM6/NTAB) family NADH-FMN oxidoreductase RutF